ncbi:MAG TPA: hypothetical protein VF735_00500 [Pyrinomonadaceae bacterium]|jgi:uncharacterized membrane protein
MAEKSKYDTNPLDPDYARRTDDVWGARRGDSSSNGASATEDISGATREMGRTPNEQARRDAKSEAPTRRYDQPLSASYPSVFIPPPSHPPASFGATPPAPSAAAVAQPPSSRTVPGMNLPENVTMVLPYIPFYLGAILGAVELFLVPRSEVRTRFHAAQGLALHMVVLVIGFLLRFASTLVSSTLGGAASVLIGIASVLFGLAAVVFFIISIIRVWKGEEHHISPLDDATRWLNEKIEPRK